MSVLPPSMTPDQRGVWPAEDTAGGKWAALHDAADVVAALAQLAPEAPSAEVRDFPAEMAGAAEWRRELAERGIEDMAAMVRAGVAALFALEARGADPVPAARALWEQFVEARAAVLALRPPADGVESPSGA